MADTDRELLEKAARAAGLDGAEYQDWPAMEVRYGFPCAMYHTDAGYWNPLEDDGDALRLAVRLNMCVTSFSDEQMVGIVIRGEGWNFHEPPGADPAAATRRAIVRAAAALAGEQT